MSKYNTPPRAGYQYVLARIRADRVGPGSDSVFDWSFAALGPSSVGYDAGCRYNTIPDPLPTNEVFTGGSVNGNVCWEVPAVDALGLLMYTDLGFDDDERRYFMLTS